MDENKSMKCGVMLTWALSCLHGLCHAYMGFAMEFSVSTSYHVTCFREASAGESALAVSIYL